MPDIKLIKLTTLIKYHPFFNCELMRKEKTIVIFFLITQFYIFLFLSSIHTVLFQTSSCVVFSTFIRDVQYTCLIYLKIGNSSCHVPLVIDKIRIVCNMCNVASNAIILWKTRDLIHIPICSVVHTYRSCIWPKKITIRKHAKEIDVLYKYFCLTCMS